VRKIKFRSAASTALEAIDEDDQASIRASCHLSCSSFLDVGDRQIANSRDTFSSPELECRESDRRRRIGQERLEESLQKDRVVGIASS
jgi:hypothetical protein